MTVRQNDEPHVNSPGVTEGTDPAIGSRISNGRLALVLDALLETGSATKAGERLGLQTSQISRLLARLRQELNDPLFIRSGRGLIPTAFAEGLRPVARSLAAGVDAIFDVRAERPGSPPFDDRWNRPTQQAVATLRTRPSRLLDGEPSLQDLEEKFADIRAGDATADRFLKYCATVSSGAGRRRALTTLEAEDAVSIVLSGEADPIQLGALFAIMQYRGVTPSELAGVVKAVRSHIRDSFGRIAPADLDWPCYVSPNVQSPPWFFHAARLVARAGHRVLLHGGTGSGPVSGRHEMVLECAGLPVCRDQKAVAEALAAGNIAYIPLASLSAQIYRVFGLHRVMATRNPVNSALTLANPASARVSLMGVANPSSRELQRDTAMLLSAELTILGSVRDVAQFNPFRSTTLHRLCDGRKSDVVVRSIREPKAESFPHVTTFEHWTGVWTGTVVDQRAQSVILATAAAALLALSQDPDAAYETMLERAAHLWQERHAPQAPVSTGIRSASRPVGKLTMTKSPG